MADWLSSGVAHRLTLTLLHFLWQAALIGLAYRAIVVVTRIQSARVRYGAALLALCAVGVCPLLTSLILARAGSAVEEIAGTPDDSSVTRQAVPASGELSFAIAGTYKQVHPAVTRAVSAISASQPYVLLAWLAGVMVLSTRLAGGVLNLLWLRSGQTAISGALARRSQRIAGRLGLQRIRVRGSLRVCQAAAVGFFRPVVLLPASWLIELPADVLEAVIAHELAHIRRCDVWVNLLQRILETLLFYHPVVWWLSNEVRRERELCCDELAVYATGEPGGYALALEQVGRMQVHGGLQLAPTFTGDGRMNLLSRIQHVLGRRGKAEQDSAWLVGIVALSIPVVLAAIVWSTMGQNAATAQEREGERGRSAESEAAPRRSAEADTGPRRPAEADTGERRPAEREGARRSAESDGARLIESFQPQTEREAALYEMIQQLQREIAALRRGRPAGDGAPRDGEVRERSGPRDGEAAPDLGRDERRQARIFQSYDRDGNGAMTLAEFQGLFEGNRDRSDMFKAADSNGDGNLSQAEFIAYRLQPRPRTEGGAAPREGDGRREGRPERR